MDEAFEIAKNLGIAIAEIILTIYICFQYIKKKMPKRPDVSQKLPGQNQIDLEIMAKMDYTKELLNADRIHVYEFHNGDHYSDYRSAYKFSCSYEAVKAGKTPVRTKCIGLPISVMPHFINKITSGETFYCEDIKEISTEMPSTHAFKRELGVHSFYDIAIRNGNGNIIGFIAIQWDDGTVPIVNEDEIKKLVWYIEDRIQAAIKLNNQ